MDKTKITFRVIGILGLFATGVVMKYQYERIASILSGESSESVVPVGKTAVEWGAGCEDIAYKDYGRSLEDVLIGAFAFNIGDDFPKGSGYNRISYKWYLKNKYYDLFARKISEAPELFKLELNSADDPNFNGAQNLILPPKWGRSISRGELSYAIDEYTRQAKESSAKDMVETVHVSVQDLVSDFEHRFVIKNKKVELWSFENGYCNLEYHEPLYRNISKCVCK